MGSLAPYRTVKELAVPKKKRIVCLVGWASSSREWANEQPPDVEIWGQNECHLFLKRGRWHRWFQIHPRNWNEEKRVQRNVTTLTEIAGSTRIVKDLRRFTDHWVLLPDSYGRGKKHLKWLMECGIPVYMQDVDERIPTSCKFPKEEVVEKFGYYLTSTSAYMAALAILEGVDEIRIAGVDMAIGTEYSIQKPCLEYLLGYAKGMGIKVTLPPLPYACPMLNAPMYAVDYLDSPPRESRPVTLANPNEELPLAAIAEDGVSKNAELEARRVGGVVEN